MDTTVNNLNNTTLRVYNFTENMESDHVGVIFDSKNFQTLNFCETYDTNGILIDCETAGCSSQNNTYLFKSELNENNFKNKTEYLSAINHEFKLKFGEESHETVVGYNFFNGHKYQTLVIASSTPTQCGLEELANELQIQILSELNQKEYVKSSFGMDIYHSENFIFHQKYFVGDPFLYHVFIR